MQVFERFGPAAFRRSCVLEGFEAFIRAQKFGGDTVVEIGTLKGLTALVLARYFEHVITIDVVDDPQHREISDMLGARNVDFLIVPDNAAKASVINALKFDAAFVDGNHHDDTESDFALVKRCGRVMMHEFWDAQPVVGKTLRAAGGSLITSGKWALWTA
jgi:protein-L-isoaspartate O-methyltransferase